MRDAGLIGIYRLGDNRACNGDMPKKGLELVCMAYYSELKIGVTRAYAAMSVNQRIDMVVRCWNTRLPVDAEIAITEDGEQYRITLKQKSGDDVDLTLTRLEDKYNVIDEEDRDYKRSFIGT